MTNRNNSIAVTGADGQLGSEIRKLASLLPRYIFSFTDTNTLDITDEQAVMAYFSVLKPGWIVNCAAYTAVDLAEDNRERAELINVAGVKNITEAARIIDCRVIHISTDYVFAGNGSVPYSETDSTEPVTVYGKSKLKGENEALKFPGSVILRTSWLYSRFGSNFPKTILRVASERTEIKVVNDQRGTPTNAEDFAKAILEVLQSKKILSTPTVSRIYHLTGGDECTWYEFAKEIIALSGQKTEVLPVTSDEYPTVARRPSYSVLDNSKIYNELGIKLPHWKESLQKWIDTMKTRK